MAIGRGIRVYHSPNQNPYTVLIEQRGQDQCLLLESQAIVSISENKPVNKPDLVSYTLYQVLKKEMP